MINKIGLLLVPGEKAILNESYSYLPPLSIATIGGYLTDKGYDVKLYDLNNTELYKYCDGKSYKFIYNKESILNYLNGESVEELNNFIEYILRDIDINNFDMIGISCGADFSLFQLHSAFILAKYIETKYKKTVAIGGNNITYLMSFKDIYGELIKSVLKNKWFIMKGPGAILWDEVIKILNGKSTKSVNELDGMIYLSENIVIENEEKDPIVTRPNWLNLNLKPYMIKVVDEKSPNDKYENYIHVFKWPYYLTKYVSDVRKNQNNSKYVNKLVLPYIFNYNCPYACAFCSESDEKRKRVIIGEVEKVISDIEFLCKTYKTNYFYFLNNASNSSPRFIEEFCKQIIDKKIDIHWSDCARFNNMTFERLQRMKEAGCKKLVFGFETASLKLIDMIEKNIDLSHAEAVLGWCSELGIYVDLELIIGLPQERDEDFKATVKYIVKNRDKLNYLAINEFFVVPKSKIGRYPEKYGIELIRNHITYERILNSNISELGGNKISHAPNFNLYKYNEIDGRGYKDVAKKNREYLKKINSLQLKEFDEVEYIYRIIEKSQAK